LHVQLSSINNGFLRLVSDIEYARIKNAFARRPNPSCLSATARAIACLSILG